MQEKKISGGEEMIPRIPAISQKPVVNHRKMDIFNMRGENQAGPEKKWGIKFFSKVTII